MAHFYGEEDPKGAVARNNGRLMYVTGIITEQTALDVNMQLLSYQKEDPISDVTMFVDSYGGDAYSMFSIVDVMDMMMYDIRTVCIGKAMSAGQMIFCNGTKGKRFMTKSSRQMVHNPVISVGGNYVDVTVEFQEIENLRGNFLDKLAQNSKLQKKEIEELIVRTKYLYPEEAIELGFADAILEKLRV